MLPTALLASLLALTGTAPQTSPATSSASNIAPAAPSVEAPQTPSLRFEPAQLDLGEMVAGQKKTGKLTVFNAGDKPVKILRIVPACGCTTISAAPAEAVAPGAHFDIDITIDPGAKTGIPLSKKITFQVEGAAAQPFTITGFVKTFVAVKPEVLEVSDASEAAPTRVTLESKEGVPFLVTGVKPDGVATLPAGTAGSGLHQEFLIDWKAWRAAGSPPKLTIVTNHANAEQLILMVKSTPATALFRLQEAQRADASTQRQVEEAQDQVILAIDSALEKQGGTGGLSMKIHRETGTLFVHGSDAQIAVVKQVVDASGAGR
ncbi:MAG: DUF1573 domain-containing protein [Planctomycetes bacterium]|nr:DUF1573 domain-containing protein [Planctomycetota bacterium]